MAKMTKIVYRGNDPLTRPPAPYFLKKKAPPRTTVFARAIFEAQSD